MARYKPVDRHLSKMLPVKFSEQIIPGTFEYAVNWLVDHQIDMSVFDARYRNDETGASAYDSSVLLKIVLAGYARGLVPSRAIERACRENVVFMALCCASNASSLFLMLLESWSVRWSPLKGYAVLVPQNANRGRLGAAECER